MEYIVVADVELDGVRMEYFSGVTLRQKFNEHHEFSIRVDYDTIESSKTSLTLSSAQKKIGKTVIIRFSKDSESSENAYEFKGIVCEIRLEQAIGMNAELVIAGYSPTIILESGQNFACFHDVKLDDVVKKLVSITGNDIVTSCSYNGMIKYICQYKESPFHFINRLSADFGECFYYDGKNLHFGKVPQGDSIKVTNGEDVNSMQLSLRATPVRTSNYSFIEKNGTLEKGAAEKPAGFGQYGQTVFEASKKLFTSDNIGPARLQQENGGILKEMARVQQAAMAANIEVLTATSFNPSISIGSTIDLKISLFDGKNYTSSDYGKYLITGIEHIVNANGRYYNSFEAVPASLTVLPVRNVIAPVAETQLATVIANEDEENMGRVKVEMLWQKELNEETGWIRVMSPDAGSGGGDDQGNTKNRGLLCIPEIGDQVLVGFRYNDPDRPFVLGSVFTGKTGEGGGENNSVKSFVTNSGSTIKFEKDKISIVDAKKKGKILFDGDGTITVETDKEIIFKCGQSSISLKQNGAISIKASDIEISGSSKVTVSSQGGDVKIDGLNVEVSAQVGAKVAGNATAEISASGQTTVKGAMVMIN